MRSRSIPLIFGLVLLAGLVACQARPQSASPTATLAATVPPSAVVETKPTAARPTPSSPPSATEPPSATPTPTTSPTAAAINGPTPGQPPIELSAGAHLFIDDYLVASRSGVTRVVNMAQRYGDKPLIQGVEPGSEFNNYNHSMDVIYDADLSRFRMWFWAYDRSGKKRFSALTQSSDGLKWRAPPFHIPGTTDNPFRSILDLRGIADDPREQYIAFSVSSVAPGWLATIYQSDNGRNWAPRSGDLIFDARYGEYWRAFVNETSDGFGILLRWNKDYTWTDLEGHQHENTIHDPTFVRQYAYSSTSDFESFTEPKLIFTPDALDSGETQLYYMGNGVRRGDYYLAMLDVLRDDLTASGVPATFQSPVLHESFPVYGTGFTVLAWSLDGEHWFRDRQTDPFLEPDPNPAAWDHAMAWASSVVQVGDLEYLYYGGYQYGHKVFADRQIGLAMVKRDRFVAQAASASPGTLLTPLVKINTTRVTLNVDAAAGSVRVQILDESGQPIPGFALEDCAAVAGLDELEAPVTCTGNWASLAGKPVQVEFKLEEAQLFGFSLQ